MSETPEFKAVVTLGFRNYESDQEVREAIDMILGEGISYYDKNYVQVIGGTKQVVQSKVEVSLSVPPFKELTKEAAAKVLARYMTPDDRTNGAYAMRGDSAGAYYLVEGVVLPALTELKGDQYFHFYHKSGTNEVLVEDADRNVVRNFASLPDKVFELADFIMALVQYCKDHESDLSKYDVLAGSTKLTPAEVVDDTSKQASSPSRGHRKDSMAELKFKLGIKTKPMFTASLTASPPFAEDEDN